MRGDSGVEDFLLLCSPTMEKYIPAFLSFGCNNVEYLIEIAQWDSKELKESLDMIIREGVQLATGDNEAAGPSKMDVMILEENLRARFGIAE